MIRTAHLRLTACLALLVAAPTVATAQGSGAAALLPGLMPAVNRIDAEVGLSDQQKKDVAGLLVDRAGRLAPLVARAGDLCLDTVLDMLVEARGLRSEFVPALNALLTDPQRAKLAALPTSREMYIDVVGGVVGEVWLGKFRERVGLADDQLPPLRIAMVGHLHDAVGIVEGLTRADGASRASILDAIVDLRSIQRQLERDVEGQLTPEQRTRLETWRQESRARKQQKNPN